MQLYSWNVNGIRAAKRKGFLNWLDTAQPDILALQETRALPEQLGKALLNPPDYHTYWASAKKKGYSGVALYCKTEPQQVRYGLGIEEFDDEGRTIIAEYDDFVLVNAYFPNGGRELARVPYKMRYYEAFLQECERYRQQGYSVIFCGDVNTSHKPIDLANPKANEKNTGFLPEERAWIDDVLDTGYVDTFRQLHPNSEGAYTWWTYRGTARERNIGWRLDYFFISPDLLPRLHAANIHADVMGSDHCPVSITLR